MNGEVEVTNRSILQGLKVRINRTGGSWIDELYHMLWAYRITQRIPTSETLFNLALETKAVIPVEFGLPSFRVEKYNEDTISVWLQINLDLIEVSRECTTIRMATYHQKVARYYNSRVKLKKF